MLQRFFTIFSPRKRDRKKSAASLYGQIVAQARQPVFYSEWGVPDTVDGRFDNILCHVALVVARLQNCGTGGLQLSQSLFDAMFRDMDLNLREIGVGDMSVRKHFKRMSRAFNGRIRNYGEAFKQKDLSQLEPILVRNLYRKTDVSAQSVSQMAGYLFGALDQLNRLPDEQILSGRLEFETPNA